VGLFASFIHILRMSGSGYYDFPDSAKPRVEITQILVCWLSTGFLLAFFAFLLKVGIDYSRGGFVAFYCLAAIGLLGARKAAKLTLASGVARGGIGRRDIVLMGDAEELAALEPRDLLAFFGATDVKHFTLSAGPYEASLASADAGIFETVAAFVRRNNCR